MKYKSAIFLFALLFLITNVIAAEDFAGLYDQATSKFYLRSYNTASTDFSNSFFLGQGNLNLIPLAGDWDGDGVDGVGLYNQANTAFWLKNSNEEGSMDYAFYFGQPGVGLIPVVGDWDGDGKDSVGLYNKTTGWFWLINKNEYGPVAIAFRFGNYYDGKGGINDWYPIAGDWDGNGKDEIAIYNKEKSEFWLRLDTGEVQKGYGFLFGNKYDNTGASFKWIPVAGDWDNNGKDEVGIYSQLKSEFWYRSSTHPTQASAYGFFFGKTNSNLIPVTGKFGNYWVGKKINTTLNTLEYQLFYKKHHFLTIIDDRANDNYKGTFNIRPHPGLDVNGWGSSLYFSPTMNGQFNYTTYDLFIIKSNGINVSAHGLIPRATTQTFGTWNTNLFFSYNPTLKEINGIGVTAINLDNTLYSIQSNLDLFKLASNRLDDVPLLNGSTGDTGDMVCANYTPYPPLWSSGMWCPAVSTDYHYPIDNYNSISIESSGEYNIVDSAAQKHDPIAAAYKPTLKIKMTSRSPEAFISFGGQYERSKSKEFWADNVGMVGLLKFKDRYNENNPQKNYIFDVEFNSKAMAADH